MIKILLRSAWDIYRSDGFKALVESTLRYFALYGTPRKILQYWIYRFMPCPTGVIAIIQGSMMILNPRSAGIHRDLLLNGIREPLPTRYLKEIMQPDWFVVDIGANIGYYALMEAQVVKWVWAIEPESLNMDNLKKNIELNGYRNITPMELALGDRERRVDFLISRASNWHRIATKKDKKKGVVIKVPMAPFDSFGVISPDFIRMDTEGYEMNILIGMDGFLKTCKPGTRIFIEVHRDLLKDYGSSQEIVLRNLAHYGFEIEKSFILAKEGPSGDIIKLLSNPKTRRQITEKGISSHIFFIKR